MRFASLEILKSCEVTTEQYDHMTVPAMHRQCQGWWIFSEKSSFEGPLSSWLVHRFLWEQLLGEIIFSWVAKIHQTTLPDSSPLKMVVSNRNLLFQGSIFRGELLFFQGGLRILLGSPTRCVTDDFGWDGLSGTAIFEYSVAWGARSRSGGLWCSPEKVLQNSQDHKGKPTANGFVGWESITISSWVFPKIGVIPNHEF